MSKSIENEQMDPKDATSVAKWYQSVMVERGYDVNFSLDDLKLVDRYCEDVLWKMDHSTELFFKEKTAFMAYLGETVVRNSKAIWIGDFDLYGYMNNYYETAVGFLDGFGITPERLAYRVSNRSESDSIEENFRKVIEKMNESDIA